MITSRENNAFYTNERFIYYIASYPHLFIVLEDLVPSIALHSTIQGKYRTPIK